MAGAEAGADTDRRQTGHVYLHRRDCPGTIYDRNGVPLVNTKTACIAVVSPTPAAAEALLSHVTDTAAFYEKLAQECRSPAR